MKTLLYLHGLASSPKGRKAALLSKRFEKEGIRVVAPDLNVPSFAKLSFESILDQAEAALLEAAPDVIVGSSLGALVALALAKRLGGGPPLVLVAPALSFGERWRTKLPDEDQGDVDFFHHGEGRSMPIHRQFFEGMAAVEVEDDPPPVAVSIVMGTDDETVPYAQVEATWKRWEASGKLVSGSRFHRVEAGDHGLVERGDDIEAAVRERLAVV